MLIFPAIDMKGGECVRLYKGEFSTAERVAPDPVSTALKFKECGASHLHMVDLDGALEGRSANLEKICETARTSGLFCEVGGGIRSMDTVEKYLSGGAGRVILGSAAVSDPAFLKDALRNYGDKIAVGVDARDGFVCTDGWTVTSGVRFTEFAKSLEQLGAQYIIFTDISKDGTLMGPNTEQLSQIINAVSCRITASGGIRDEDDIRAVKEIGAYAVICGKSIYSGTLDLRKSIEIGEKGE